MDQNRPAFSGYSREGTVQSRRTLEERFGQVWFQRMIEQMSELDQAHEAREKAKAAYRKYMEN